MISLADIFKFAVQALACRCYDSLKAVLRTRVAVSILLASGFWFLAPSPALAQYRPDITPDAGPANIPNPVITEKAGAKLPLDLSFKDSSGNSVHLSDYFNHGRPVVLSLVYFSCPMLCGLNQDGLVGAVKGGPNGLQLGKDYEVIVVSIDPDDTPKIAATKRENYLRIMGLPSSQSGFTYLTGKEEDIKNLADTVGFGYRKNFNPDASTGKYAHSTGYFICTPDARLSQTIGGIQLYPDQLHNSLISASQGRLTRGFFYTVGFACGAMRLNPLTGRPEANPWFFAGTAGGIISIIFMATLLSILWRGEAKRNKASTPPPTPTAPTT